MMRFLSSASTAIDVSAFCAEARDPRDGVVTVLVTAPAIEGRASEAVRRLAAKRLGVARSSVTIVRGHRSRHKVVEIDGLDRRTVRDALTRQVALPDGSRRDQESQQTVDRCPRWNRKST
jgi:uncharacterized protein YggU (UPF0235/DUF167 family)